MVKHIVFWKLKDEALGQTKEQNAKVIKQRLEALVGVVPGLLKAEVGLNFNPNGFDVGLYSELASKEALDVYQNHPVHMEIKGFVHEVVRDRAVCDWEY